MRSRIILFITVWFGCLSTALALVQYPMTVANIAELQALSVPWVQSAEQALTLPTNVAVYVLGYYNPGDRGGGMFQWDPNSSATPEGGRFFPTNGWTSGNGRWIRQLNGEVANVKMWGAKGDWHPWIDSSGASAHDDTTNIQNALNTCDASALDSDINTPWTRELLFPASIYKVTDTLVWNPQQTRLRGEHGLLSELMMAPGIQKDILRGAKADQFLKGGNPADPSDQEVRIDDLFFRFSGWETNQIANPTNACLCISAPQEGNTIHNVSTYGGAFGIRCFGGGGGAPFAVRDVVATSATIAGISIEPIPGASSCGGHVSIIGVTGDYFFGQAPSSASLVRLQNFIGSALIDDLNAEGSYGAGVIRHKFPDLSSGLNSSSAAGMITIRNCVFNGTFGFDSNDFLVLEGGQRTASIEIEGPLAMYTGGNLIKDDVTGRRVPADVAVYSGGAQTAARLPLNYEGSNDGSTNTILGPRSSLIVGQTAIYSFIPTNTGWYRIMAPIGGAMGLISGRLVIGSYFREGSEFEVNVNPDGGSSSPWINVLRSSKVGTFLPPLATKARAFYYFDTGHGDYWAGVDVYVANVITNAYRDQEKRLMFSLPVDQVQLLDIGCQQLLSPTVPVSTGSGDTDGLPSGAVYTVTNIVR